MIPPRLSLVRIALALAVWLGASMSAMASDRHEFVRDVVPALTRLGCNAGTCHGAFSGRGGFALSLLGFDPLADYDTIVKASRGRRVEPSAPANSLLLLKATGAVPHGGGRKLDPKSPAYRILFDYLSAGMSAPIREGPSVTRLTVQPPELTLKREEHAALRVAAKWSDGVERDVTDWSLFDARDPQTCGTTATGDVHALRTGRTAISVRYMGQVASVAVAIPSGEPPSTVPFTPVNFIDELAQKEWRRLGLAPAVVSSDTEFLRRVSLDLTGTLPTPNEARDFLANRDPHKRTKLIDDLLERPEYVDFWAMKWSDLFRVHRRYVGDKGLGSFNGWVRASVRDDKPLDVMTRELLTAKGNLFANGPVAYYFVDQKPDELAETTTQVFLGIRMQCARCHHHPFEVWSQDDYWSLAAFFTRLEIRENGEQGRFGGLRSVRVTPTELRLLPVPAKPKVLGGPPITDGDDPRIPLATWVTAKENPYFARNFANRIWSHLLGRGLVEPVDDLRATNPASNPALFDALAKELVDYQFRTKHLIRTICRSQVYQLAGEVAPTRDTNGSQFTHRHPRRLPAEVLLDAINDATGFREEFVGAPPNTRAIALPDPTTVSSFLTTFGRPLRNSPCDCARESAPDLLQALMLANGAAMHKKITDANGRVAGLLAKKSSDAEAIEELYLATLTRRPTEAELLTVRELLKDAPSRQEGLEDLLWALLNSPEFSFQH